MLPEAGEWAWVGAGGCSPSPPDAAVPPCSGQSTPSSAWETAGKQPPLQNSRILP